MGFQGTLIGYTIDNNESLELLIKELTYEGITYSLSDPVNNYQKLRNILNDKYTLDFYSTLTDENYFNKKGVYEDGFENVLIHDDIVLNDVDGDEGIFWKKNPDISIIPKNTYISSPIICLFNGINGCSDQIYDEQVLLDLMTWKNQLLASGRLKSNPKFASLVVE